MRNYFKLGDWNVICDVCGKKLKSSDSVLSYDNLIVCKEDLDEKHPQESRNIIGRQKPLPKGRVRPEATDTFVS